MSAIFGIWDLNGKMIEESNINIMRDLLKQYGRDGQDVYVDKNIALGCCFNKMSKVSEELDIIYTDSNKSKILIADAQIYNRQELIGEYKLTDNSFISNNSLLMLAYKKWGQDFPKYINGDFAVVIWEKEKKQLLVVRDHLGATNSCIKYRQAYSNVFESILFN